LSLPFIGLTLLLPQPPSGFAKSNHILFSPPLPFSGLSSFTRL